MSSAYRKILGSGERSERVMSFIKIIKSRGPRIEPCGTPEVTGREEWPTRTN